MKHKRECFNCSKIGEYEEDITYTEEDGYICWECYSKKYIN